MRRSRNGPRFRRRPPSRYDHRRSPPCDGRYAPDALRFQPIAPPAPSSPAAPAALWHGSRGLDPRSCQPLVERPRAALRIGALPIHDQPNGDALLRFGDQRSCESVANQPRPEAELVDVDQRTTPTRCRRASADRSCGPRREAAPTTRRCSRIPVQLTTPHLGCRRRSSGVLGESCRPEQRSASPLALFEARVIDLSIQKSAAGADTTLAGFKNALEAKPGAGRSLREVLLRRTRAVEQPDERGVHRRGDERGDNCARGPHEHVDDRDEATRNSERRQHETRGAVASQQRERGQSEQRREHKGPDAPGSLTSSQLRIPMSPMNPRNTAFANPKNDAIVTTIALPYAFPPRVLLVRCSPHIQYYSEASCVRRPGTRVLRKLTPNGLRPGDAYCSARGWRSQSTQASRVVRLRLARVTRYRVAAARPRG